VSERFDFSATLGQLLNRRDLTAEETRTFFEQLLSGEIGDAEAAAILVALRMKGESAGELAAGAQCLREKMLRFDTGRNDVLDTCGTGGDGAGSFNISTAAALVAAGAGVPVVKHGNRAVSSRTGSADVLAELGVNLDGAASELRSFLDRTNFTFCFAPHFHPALKQIGPLRKRLGIRTIFNLLGPLANPAGAAYQLLGVGRIELLDPMAGALAQLGLRHGYVVCADDGFDEISLSTKTHFRCVRSGNVSQGVWTAADFGLEPCRLDELQAVDAKQSASIIEGVLGGLSGPAQRIVAANSAVALLAAERTTDLRDAVSMAMQSILSGRAKSVLEGLRSKR